MDEKDKNILKKGLLKPTTDFNANLMNKIDAQEEALTNAISTYGVMEPSPSFTDQLMAKLENKSAPTAYAPVISRGAWIGIAATIAVILVLAVAFPESGSSKLGISDSLDNAKTAIQSFFTFNGVYLYVLLGGFVASVAFLIEQRFSRQ